MSVLRKTHQAESTAVDSFTVPRFDIFGGDLDITWASGRVYRYHGVPREVIEELKWTEADGGSVGRFINRQIKGRYDHTEL